TNTAAKIQNRKAVPSARPCSQLFLHELQPEPGKMLVLFSAQLYGNIDDAPVGFRIGIEPWLIGHAVPPVIVAEPITGNYAKAPTDRRSGHQNVLIGLHDELNSYASFSGTRLTT